MFDALKKLDLDTLPADMRAAILAISEQVVTLSEQNATLTESNAALTTQKAELEALNARLEHFVKELNQVIYGTRSEKLTEDERQGLLPSGTRGGSHVQRTQIIKQTLCG